MSRLRRPDICAPGTYQELVRTPRIQQRLLTLGLKTKPISERERRQAERERRADEIARLMRRYNRASLYEQVWTKPALEVAKCYGVSGCTSGQDLPHVAGTSPTERLLGAGANWPGGEETILATVIFSKRTIAYLFDSGQCRTYGSGDGRPWSASVAVTLAERLRHLRYSPA